MLFNDDALTKLAKEQLTSPLEDVCPVVDGFPQHASEDFAYLVNEVPSVYFNLCNPVPEKSEHYSVYHHKVVFGEGMMPVGAAALAHLATEYLKGK